MRANAVNWLETADRVWHYRRDRMTGAEAGELNRHKEELRRRWREGADAARLKLAIEELEGALGRAGGAVYPKSALAENVEFFLVAAIVIFGIRAYFLQLFEIPTNSMWPTYYGMTAENFPPGRPAPGGGEEILRFLTLGARPREVVAPAAGAVSALFSPSGQLAYSVVDGRGWLFLPEKMKEYTFFVGGQPATVRVPIDFSDAEFNQLVIESFFGSERAFAEQWTRMWRSGRMEETEMKMDEDSGAFGTVWRLPLNRNVREGEAILRFDVLTGDKLVVDRLSYNFVRPQPGSAMVFRTGNNPAIGAAAGHPEGMDEYYVKRLVGLPGDVIEIRQPVLYRNGRPITGADAFDLNARRVGLYRGYFNKTAADGARYLLKGESLTVPARSFLGLGDNSNNSLDGRYWGFVPEKDLVGRPLFIHYPFTRRWGPAK
jgi:signal peptidase I